MEKIVFPFPGVNRQICLGGHRVKLVYSTPILLKPYFLVYWILSKFWNPYVADSKLDIKLKNLHVLNGFSIKQFSVDKNEKCLFSYLMFGSERVVVVTEMRGNEFYAYHYHAKQIIGVLMHRLVGNV